MSVKEFFSSLWSSKGGGEEKRADQRYLPAAGYPLQISLLYQENDCALTIEDISNGGILLSTAEGLNLVSEVKYPLQIDFERESFQIEAEHIRSYEKDGRFFHAFSMHLSGDGSELYFQIVAPVAIGQSFLKSSNSSETEFRYFGISDSRIIYWVDEVKGDALEFKSELYIYKIDPGESRAKIFFAASEAGAELDGDTVIEITPSFDNDLYQGAVRFYRNVLANFEENVALEVRQLMEKVVDSF